MTRTTLTIAVLATGEELLSGELSDTNSAVIARELAAHGLALQQVRVVGDREQSIAAALDQLAREHRLVIVTGGLGPTADDVTARAAARACGRHLVLNDEALQLIRQYFKGLGRQMHPGNEKQALLPQKCQVLPNPRGTAPGFRLELHEAELFFLPGVPEEMLTMLRDSVLPSLAAHFRGGFPLQERILKVFALAEPRIEELLAPCRFPEGVSVAYGVQYPLVLVKLRAGGADAEADLDRGELLVRQALGDYLVGRDQESLEGNVGKLLTTAGLNLALAESCTGGLISKLLTDLPGASTFLERCGVTYANSAKQGWLGISAELLEQHGAVSEACALAMARGIRQAAGTDLGLAVTGIAGPDGGTPEKPVGTVFIALDSPEFSRARGYRFSGSRDRIRTMTACMALDWLRRYAGNLLQTDPEPVETTPQT